MKNNKAKKRNCGMAIILVISAIGLVGVVMLFLSSASNSMMFQVNDVYLKACERNLTCSGLNWARTNIKNGTVTNFNDTIPLDVNDMNILNSSLELKIDSSSTDQNLVKISTSCARSRQSLSNQRTFTIE